MRSSVRAFQEHFLQGDGPVRQSAKRQTELHDVVTDEPEQLALVHVDELRWRRRSRATASAITSKPRARRHASSLAPASTSTVIPWPAPLSSSMNPATLHAAILQDDDLGARPLDFVKQVELRRTFMPKSDASLRMRSRAWSRAASGRGRRSARRASRDRDRGDGLPRASHAAVVPSTTCRAGTFAPRPCRRTTTRRTQADCVGARDAVDLHDMLHEIVGGKVRAGGTGRVADAAADHRARRRRSSPGPSSDPSSARCRPRKMPSIVVLPAPLRTEQPGDAGARHDVGAIRRHLGPVALDDAG